MSNKNELGCVGEGLGCIFDHTLDQHVMKIKRKEIGGQGQLMKKKKRMQKHKL